MCGKDGSREGLNKVKSVGSTSMFSARGRFRFFYSTALTASEGAAVKASLKPRLTKPL
jgi:hypothetical protein